MKMDSKRLIKLLMEGKAQLIDIRFQEEHTAWSVGYSKSIPLNGLPKRLNEIDKNKIISRKPASNAAFHIVDTSRLLIFWRDLALGAGEKSKADLPPFFKFI